MFDRPEPPAGSAAPVARVRLRPLRGAPEQREMVLILGLAFFLNLFPGTLLQILNTRWGLVITQAAFIAGPVLLALRWFYLDRRAVLPLRRPALDILAATALGTVGLNHLLTIAGAWQERLFPTPDSLRAFFINLFVYDGPVDYALLLVVFAVVPAICEEILFRGFLQTGLVRLLESPSRGIAASSLVFALFHLDPWRFAGILVLGAFLGYLTYRTGSLVPAILAHALNNLLSISMAASGALDEGEAIGSAWTAGLAIALLGLAVLLVHRGRAGRSSVGVL